jgi:hypothetical protein
MTVELDPANMQEFKLKRDGNSDIKFSGWKIGSGNSRNGDYWSFHNLGDVTAFKKGPNQDRAFRHSF